MANMAKIEVDPATLAEPYLERGLPALTTGFPNGWMSATDLKVLYNCAYRTKGPILEVGPWLGRSTSSITAAMRDREETGVAPDVFNHTNADVVAKNLKDNGLLPYVTNVIRGNFLDCPIQRKYKMIFCDATHDDQEVHDNVPALAKVAAKGCTYVFDDVVSQQRVDLIMEYIKPKRHFMTRSVFPNPKKRCKLLVVET